MYDAGARPEAYLREYADEFASVEVDSTFYGTPPPARVRAWATQVPPHFTFAFKLPREITHEHRLLHARALVDEFVASALELGEQLEAILIQMPSDFVPAEIENVESFVGELPAGPRWALEVRNREWFHGDARARLRDALGTHGVALAATDSTFVPLDDMLHELRRPTASHAYVRWIGGRDAVARFDAVVIDRTEDVARWTEAIRDAAPQLTRLAGYANNHYAGFSPATVRMVYDALGVPHVIPKRVEQTSLFDA
ncbi:MAG TPA: DUF72 domain-containing protein [Candidatus Elarobacter sp.]|jgi:uncharacterized protein YecE (DUF72 family)|nr:DUF72 domain-containing protein [Candidatus Elarobacter sp.]